MYRLIKSTKNPLSQPALGWIGLILVAVLFVCLISACQSADSEIPPTTVGSTPAQDEQTQPGNQTDEASNDTSTDASTDNEGSSSETEGQDPGEQEIEDESRTDPEADLIDIQVAWESSPHADSFVLNEEGANSTCARCHAPVNWIPSMDDVPAACLTCKFELTDPPPLIPESEWEHIPCRVCHEEDRRGNLDPAYAWLEIAQLGEYADVDTPTELCLKCHNEIDLPDHALSTLGGAHADYECTQCHDAHDTVASCTAAGCHDDVIDPASPIPGHDEDHQAVSCVACHDADGLEVGPVEESGLWMTFFTVLSPEGEASVIPFTSHNTVLEAPCERCHFAGNPWGLVDTVSPAP